MSALVGNLLPALNQCVQDVLGILGDRDFFVINLELEDGEDFLLENGDFLKLE